MEGGLLTEILPDSTVQFVHFSAKEWVIRKQFTEKCNNVESAFDLDIFSLGLVETYTRVLFSG